MIEERDKDCTDCALYWLNNNSKTPCGGSYLLELCKDFIGMEDKDE